MTISSSLPKLTDLSFLPYLDDTGKISSELEGKIGIYAIFDQNKNLRYIGYSRNLFLSLKQHLVRQSDNCSWLKLYSFDRPNRTILEEIKQNWLAENQDIPEGNGEKEHLWIQPIDAKLTMTMDETREYQRLDEISKVKFLKKIARKLEEDIKEKLNLKGVTMEIRFNPKLKEEGLLDLK
ncbi:GIY-YIG nuclease family protein [Cyanobacterium sp. Dongsha4]|uniref:GIY-YIG nuclease family protein n=1 Tax=Cyanobacterium sp. DS4 TaxID=2878255 RepID=UPI002E80174C|nr:GIY-YIG nuclease family protein [Cyanobacterium sp. Dongsha4]WVK99513.1 GIY-YIG nuclease family protein [Cyanobacterium sp. Dongsha4]